MPKCGCSSDTCSCHYIAGAGVSIAGAGSRTNPYVIEVDPTTLPSTGNPENGGGTGTTATGRLVGEIIEYGGPTAPSGWLLCDGSEVNRTVYSDLFAIIGTVYGAGNGTTTFNLPNFGGKVPLGVNGTYARGSSGGSATITSSMLPQHSHSMDHDHPLVTTSSNGSHTHSTGRSLNSGGSPSTYAEGEGVSKVTDRQLTVADGAHTHTVDVPAYTGSTGTSGSASPATHLPPYVAVNRLIKF